MASIDLKSASLILDRALTEAKFANDKIGNLISSVLYDNYKTYKYVLVTALLAKSTNGAINALSLQKGDGSNGRYDARSLCHKVIVPFETIKLPGCLGNSNEPFLNKPARFEYISLDNAVRRGHDKVILENVIFILSQIKTSAVAYKYLCSSVYNLKEISASYISKYSIGDNLIDTSEFSQLVLDYVYQITEYSSEGEICPLVVSQLEQMYLGKDFKVEPHKVNQSGASSKEVGDIDVYNNQRQLIYSIEVKDKDFTAQDVLHAIKKFRQADLNTSLFVYGKNVSFDKEETNKALKQSGLEGHFCCLISIIHYSKLRIADLKTITIRDFVDGLLAFSKIINAKDETIDLIKRIIDEIFNINKQ